MKLRKLLPALCLSAGWVSAQDTNTVEELKRTTEDLNRRVEALEQEKSKSPLSLRSGRFAMDLGLIGTFSAGTSSARDIQGGTQLGGHDPNERGFTLQGVEAAFAGAVDPYFRANANVLFSIDSDGESFFELEEAFMETISLPGNLQLRGGQYLTEFGRHNPTHPHAWAFVDTPLVNGRFLGPDGLRNPGARLSWLTPTPFYSELFLSVQDSHGETATPFRSEGGQHHDEAVEEGLPFAFRHSDNDRGIEEMQDLLFAARYALSFDVTDSQTLLLGASAAFGPNSSGAEDAGDTDTQIYGVDLTWKWKSTTHSGGFPFVTWQSEAMVRRYEAGRFDWANAAEGGLIDPTTGDPAVVPGETLVDYGAYTQILYGFRKGWVAGLRFDYLWSEQADYDRGNLIDLDFEPVGADPSRGDRWRVSPNITWYPTEFSKIRLQYNYDDRQDIGRDHSIWLQLEFVLGAHGAHKF